MSNETKHEKFVRLRDRRVPAAQQAFKVLRNLASGDYEYSPDEAKAMHQTLQAECDELARVFGLETEPEPAPRPPTELGTITKDDELALIMGLGAHVDAAIEAITASDPEKAKRTLLAIMTGEVVK